MNGVATGQPSGGDAGLAANAVAVTDTDEADDVFSGGVPVGLAGPALHDVNNNGTATNRGSLASTGMENLRPRRSKLLATAHTDRAGIIRAHFDPEEGCL
jgi:hypothetical protein